MATIKGVISDLNNVEARVMEVMRVMDQETLNGVGNLRGLGFAQLEGPVTIAVESHKS